MQRTTLAQACHADWGERDALGENYAVSCVELLMPYLRGGTIRRVLDMGCGIGRSSFELARYVDEVTAVESDARFVWEAQRLKESGRLSYTFPLEGALTKQYEVMLNKYGLTHASKKVNFWQGEMAALKPLFNAYDLILSHHILTRLHSPKSYLLDMFERLRPGGILAIVSSYDWHEDVTPKEQWLGGFTKEGRAIKTLEGIRGVLEPQCQLAALHEVVKVQPLTERIATTYKAQMSIWKRIA